MIVVKMLMTTATMTMMMMLRVVIIGSVSLNLPIPRQAVLLLHTELNRPYQYCRWCCRSGNVESSVYSNVALIGLFLLLAFATGSSCIACVC